MSSDGFGNTSNTGTISAQIPPNSTIVQAYLYSAAFSTGNYESMDLTGLTLNGQTVTFQTYFKNQWGSGYFKTGRADVTSIVQAGYGNGNSITGIYDFTVTEQNSEVDGEALVVIYSNSSLPERTIAILDGGANIDGDEVRVSFPNGLDKSSSDFIAEMYLGISFSYPNQSSTVTVNGTTITSNAGGYDDGTGANGGLITVGGYDDSYSSLMPAYGDDHERYDISDQISDGDTQIDITTINPSQDDNLFLVIFNISGEGDVDVTNPVQSDCKININSLNITGTREVGSPVTFTMDVDNSCSETVYYRFSYHADYGTNDYDGRNWVKTSPEYTTSNSHTFTFDEAGKYIIVIWAKNATTDSNDGVDIIGVSVNISDEGDEPYFPW